MSLAIVNRLCQSGEYFKDVRILALGDVALDRTFFCKDPTPGVHAIHGSERAFDIEPTGDDFGEPGSIHNTFSLARSLGASCQIVTAIGNDAEGEKLVERFKEKESDPHLVRFEGIQTVTRYRFFVWNEPDAR